MARRLSVCVRIRLAPSLWNIVTLHHEWYTQPAYLAQESLGSTPSPGVDQNHSRGVFCVCT